MLSLPTKKQTDFYILFSKKQNKKRLTWTPFVPSNIQEYLLRTSLLYRQEANLPILAAAVIQCEDVVTLALPLNLDLTVHPSYSGLDCKKRSLFNRDKFTAVTVVRKVQSGKTQKGLYYCCLILWNLKEAFPSVSLELRYWHVKL